MGLVLWRLLVAATGLAGYLLAVADFGGDLKALSQDASLATGVAYAALVAVSLVRPATGWAWLRGALATTLVLVAGTFQVLLSGGLSSASSLFEHLLTPVLVAVDYLVAGPLLGEPRSRGSWWWPVTWLVLPVAYLVAYVAGDFAVYDFLDPGDSGFAGTVTGFVVATLLLGVVVWGIRAALDSTLPPSYDRDIS